MTNAVKNLSLYPELLATFLAICEEGRELNHTSPAVMKPSWLCFGYWSTDCGKSIEVVLKIRLDGPLADRDCFEPRYTRSGTFKQYRLGLKRRIEKANIHFFSSCDWDNMGREALIRNAKEMQQNLVRFRDVTSGNLKYLELLEQIPLNDLLKGLHEGGADMKMKEFIRYFRDIETPLVLIDQEGNMGAVELEDGEIVTATPPAWLNGLVLYREGRRVAFGDAKRNGQIDRHAYKNKFKTEAKITKRSSVYTRAGDRKRQKQGEPSRSYDR